MTISRETIEKIRNSLDIVEIVKEYIPDLKKVGKDYRAICPFHKEKTPSFFVSPQKNIFHCFGCQFGGDIFKFIMRYENITYPEAIKKLAMRANIEIKEDYFDKQSERKPILEILNQAGQFYHKYLFSNEAKTALNYLISERKVNKEIINRFLLGYAPEGNKLLKKANEKYDINLLLKTGLISISDKTNKPYDFLHNRIVFPIFDQQGNIIAFGGRLLTNTKIDAPLYLNTYDTPVYSKSFSLYGIYQAIDYIRKIRKVILLEGYFDVLLLYQNNIGNVVAPLGTSLTHEQIRLLKRYADEIYLVFDSDDSGNQAAIRAGDICLEEDILCRIISLPKNMDPDEYVLKYGKDKFDELLAKGLHPVEFKIEVLLKKYDITKPEDKRDVVINILDTFNRIQDPIIRNEMIKLISSKLYIKEELLLSELRKISRTKKIGAKESIFDTINVKIRSAEEEIVILCLQNPLLSKQLDINIFNDERCIKILSLVKEMSDTEINLVNLLDLVDTDTGNWLTQLSFEQRDYSSPEKVIEKLVKDLELHHKEKRRRELEREFIYSFDNNLSIDSKKTKEYIELTKLLKGSK